MGLSRSQISVLLCLLQSVILQNLAVAFYMCLIYTKLHSYFFKYESLFFNYFGSSGVGGLFLNFFFLMTFGVDLN